MQVKKFEAPTMSEALKLVKAELGPDAIILSTKKHRKGFGLLSKPLIEITAAISERALMNKKITERIVPELTKQKLAKFSAAKQKQIYDDFGTHYQERVLRKKEKEDQQLANQQMANQRFANYSRVGLQSGDPPVAGMPSTVMQPEDLSGAAWPHFSPPAKSLPAVEVPTAGINVQQELSILRSMIEQLKSTQAQIADSKISDNSTHQVYVEFQN